MQNHKGPRLRRSVYVILALRERGTIIRPLVIDLRYVFSHVNHMFPLWADEEKPVPVPASLNTPASSTAAPVRTASHLPFLNKLQELNTSRFSSTIIVFPSFIADILFFVQIDLHWVHVFGVHRGLRDLAEGCL